MVETFTKSVTKTHNRVPVDLADVYAVCSLLRENLQRARREGKKFKDIAYAINMSPTTVSKLAYGETREPRFSTTIKLLHYFEYRVTAQ